MSGGTPTKPDFQTETYQWLHDFTVTVTTTPQPVVAREFPCFKLVLQADPGTQTNILVGNQFSQNMVIAYGGSYTMPIGDANLVYVRTAAGTNTLNVHVYMNRRQGM